MLPTERHWTALLAGGLLAVGALTLGPALRPPVTVPTVTRVALPPPATPPEAAPEYPTTSSVTPLISGRLNLNTATTEQLEALPRVGPALAARIVAGRPYRSLADLDGVKGIGPSTLEDLAPLVTF
ncbi:ComEA family DNA-binding protein [Deinococcus sp. SDU3-2]|uniref:ComEA family DNA-binding protein n=1 Tax=Deinococcus terrestris TaxID=2651870 RepID=A0A7X1TR77_9DEIO|nr:ComEA family DNA-binding protein [Deinococcus terrestris]MPY66042.1 ComEA family DNA-binding protein [Deinococcus terrestris]